MTATEILTIVTAVSGLSADTIKLAEKSGVDYEYKCIAAMMMHEEGWDYATIGEALNTHRGTILSSVRRTAQALGKQRWEPDYNKRIKTHYLQCIAMLARIEDDRAESEAAISDDIIFRTFEYVSQVRNVPFTGIMSVSRSHQFARSRIMGVFVVRFQYPDITLKEIGAVLNRDHSTIIYNYKRGARLFKRNALFKDEAKKVMELMEQSERKSA